MKEISLTKGYTTIVDDEDHDELIKFKWFAIETVTGPNGFHICAARWIAGPRPRTCIRMRHQILCLPSSTLVDHKNRNPLDNRRDNLEISDKSRNAYNSNRSINASGIYYDKRRNRFKAFKLRPAKSYVGTFKTKQEA